MERGQRLLQLLSARRRSVALVTAALALCTACGDHSQPTADSTPRPGHALPEESGMTGHAASVGEVIEFQLPIDPPDRQTVRLDSVQLTRPPSGLSVEGLHAYDRRQFGKAWVVITERDRRTHHFTRRPFRGLTVTPASQYYETIGFVAQRPGRYRVAVKTVTYRVGETLLQQPEPWEYDIDVTAP